MSFVATDSVGNVAVSREVWFSVGITGGWVSGINAGSWQCEIGALCNPNLQIVGGVLPYTITLVSGVIPGSFLKVTIAALTGISCRNDVRLGKWRSTRTARWTSRRLSSSTTGSNSGRLRPDSPHEDPNRQSDFA